MRFAGEEADLSSLMEDEMNRGRDLRAMRESSLGTMRRSLQELMRVGLEDRQRAAGVPPGWDGTQPIETFEK